jgi:hypothetical protein
MTGVLIKRGHLKAHIYTGRMPCKDEDRGQGIASSSQEMSKISSK